MEKEELQIILEELGFFTDGVMSSACSADNITPSSYGSLTKQLAGYFKNVVRNCVISWLRQKQRYLARCVLEDYDTICEGEFSDPYKSHFYVDFDDLYRDFMLERLSPDTVENIYLSDALSHVCDLDLLILNMYYAYGFTDDEIAWQLGITRQRVNYIRLGLLSTLRIDILNAQRAQSTIHMNRMDDKHGYDKYTTDWNTEFTIGSTRRRTATRDFNTCQRKRCICNTICTRKI